MRFLGRLLTLTLALLPLREVQALDFFGEFLYWQATETVDWTLKFSGPPQDMTVAYQSSIFNFAPGFRVGVDEQGDLDQQFYYTHFSTSTSDSATGDQTGGFMGAKLNAPPAPYVFFNAGQMFTSINYNIFDWDIGKRYYPADLLTVRPIFGLRGGWINQSINTAFQGNYLSSGLPVAESLTERMTNNFWGIGPKAGIQNTLSLWRSEELEINCTANFCAAYLLGHWSIGDATNVTNTVVGVPLNSAMNLSIHNRDFGAVAFQAIVGLNFRYRNWSGTLGYEINDWLNQCQIFDDATGPHNNDLLLQGLTARLGCGF